MRRAQEPPAPSTDQLDLLTFIDTYLEGHIRGEKSELHREIAELLASEERLAVAAPRGHAKSTLVTLAYVLQQTAYKAKKFVLIVSDTANQAADHVGNIQKELLENEKLLADFPHLKLPELAEYKNKKVRRKATDFITTGGVRFAAKGAGGGLRGLREGSQRPDLIVVDDLENDKNVQTPRQRQKLKDWFQKSLSNLFGADGGQLAVIGTILHKDALLAWLLSDDSPAVYAKRKYSAITEDPETGDKRAIWPAAWSLERLAAKLDEIKSRAFATEYLNDPAADDQVLFKQEWIGNRRKPADFAVVLERIVVALDPSTSADGQRDACGIVIAGRDESKHRYVLADRTINASPSTWARRALDAYHDFDADEIVAEANQGGAMIESTLKAELRPGEQLPPIKLVHATKGKAIRAEPIAVAYERGEVSHIGHLSALEVEMCTWVPGTYSPNRLDAAVWGLHRLGEAHGPMIEFW